MTEGRVVDGIVKVDQDMCLNCRMGIARNHRKSGVVGAWFHVYSGEPFCAPRLATPSGVEHPIIPGESEPVIGGVPGLLE